MLTLRNSAQTVERSQGIAQIALFAMQRLGMTVFDAIQNGVTGVGNPLQQFDGIGFEQGRLVKLPPVQNRMCAAHILVYMTNAGASSTPLFVIVYMADGPLRRG
jgi:hypothetical protein